MMLFVVVLCYLLLFFLFCVCGCGSIILVILLPSPASTHSVIFYCDVMNEMMLSSGFSSISKFKIKNYNMKYIIIFSKVSTLVASDLANPAHLIHKEVTLGTG